MTILSLGKRTFYRTLLLPLARSWQCRSGDSAAAWRLCVAYIAKTPLAPRACKPLANLAEGQYAVCRPTATVRVEDRRARALRARQDGYRLGASGASFAARRTVEQMRAERADTTKTADGEPAERSLPVGPITREAGDVTRTDHMIDEWGRQSFPASDPPPTW